MRCESSESLSVVRYEENSPDASWRTYAGGMRLPRPDAPVLSPGRDGFHAVRGHPSRLPATGGPDGEGHGNEARRGQYREPGLRRAGEPGQDPRGCEGGAEIRLHRALPVLPGFRRHHPGRHPQGESRGRGRRAHHPGQIGQHRRGYQEAEEAAERRRDGEHVPPPRLLPGPLDSQARHAPEPPQAAAPGRGHGLCGQPEHPGQVLLRLARRRRPDHRARPRGPDRGVPRQPAEHRTP